MLFCVTSKRKKNKGNKSPFSALSRRFMRLNVRFSSFRLTSGEGRGVQLRWPGHTCAVRAEEKTFLCWTWSTNIVQVKASNTQAYGGGVLRYGARQPFLLLIWGLINATDCKCVIFRSDRAIYVSEAFNLDKGTGEKQTFRRTISTQRCFTHSTSRGASLFSWHFWHNFIWRN